MIEFTMLGTPQPQGSKTRTRFGMREDNANLQPWRDAMLYAITQAMKDHGVTGPMLGPVELEVTFHFARPRSHYGTGRNVGRIKDSAPGKYHAQKPDTDKLLRALGDALKIAGAIRDDSQIALISARKYWDDSAHMCVYLERMP